MSNYRRAREGDTFFFTVVTHGRQTLLCQDGSRAVLEGVIKETQARMRLEINAWDWGGLEKIEFPEGIGPEQWLVDDAYPTRFLLNCKLMK